MRPYLTGSERGDAVSAVRNVATTIGLLAAELREAVERLATLARDLESPPSDAKGGTP
jgi:hypothetical protein